MTMTMMMMTMLLLLLLLLLLLMMMKQTRIIRLFVRIIMRGKLRLNILLCFVLQQAQTRVWILQNFKAN